MMTSHVSIVLEIMRKTSLIGEKNENASMMYINVQYINAIVMAYFMNAGVPIERDDGQGL